MDPNSSNIHKNILVADAGGSKAAWCQILNGKTEQLFSTPGLNAYFLNDEEVYQWIKTHLDDNLKDKNLDAIYYYGAGCDHPDNRTKLKSAFKRVFENAHIEVNTDTFGAARGSCLREKGIACIIGTGSSSCLYDGNKILEDRSGLGYALGDEGSGSHFGKLILKSYLYGMFSEQLKARFIEQFGDISRDEILENIYKKPFPNRYLGSFTPFLSKNRGDEFVEKILEQGFEEFFRCSITRHSNYQEVKVNFVGSLPLVFKDVLEKLLKKHNITAGNFQQNPIDGLVKYHSQH